MSSDIAISVEGLGKCYRIQHKARRPASFAEAVRGAAAAPFKYLGDRLRTADESELFWALKDISFEVRRGEALGVIGKNGAGKSTLLKILSRITDPTTGHAEIRGHVNSLLEVGTGFHPELSGRENIYMNAAMHGMKRAEINAKLDEILDFAEVEKFIDTPVKRYSSGMYTRLAFAVAANLEPEILVIDEVLAVGDLSFQKKCLGKMNSVAASGRTILFVSHAMAAISELCPRCLWIDSGQVRMMGETSQVVSSYMRHQDRSGGTAECSFAESLEKEFQVLSGRLQTASGQITQQFQCDESVIIDLACVVHKRVPGLYGYMTVSTLDGIVVWETDSFDTQPNSLDNLPEGPSRLVVTLPPRTLGPGTYAIYMSFASASSVNQFHVDIPGIMFTFQLDDVVTRRGPQRRGYLSALPDWRVQSGPHPDIQGVRSMKDMRGAGSPA